MIRKVVFFLPMLSQPRCHKRINAFLDVGIPFDVYAFDRGVYSESVFKYPYKVKILGNVKDKERSIKRFYLVYREIRRVLTSYNKKEVVFYGFGLEICFYLMLFRLKYIYEISDLLYTYFSNKNVVCIFRHLDKLIVRKSDLCIMTSGGFFKYLYPHRTNNRIEVIPNKMNSSINAKLSSFLEKTICTSKLSFAYVGAFRYPNTVFRFAKIIGEKYPNHTFHFFGDSIYTPVVRELSEQYPNIIYHGSFKNPEDLVDIYNKIDIVVAAYDTKDINEQIAEPNKLYEALYFNKPIIVSPKTFLAEQVKKYDCGYSIDCTKDENIINFLDNIDQADVERIINTLTKLKKSNFVDNPSLIVNSFSEIYNYAIQK